MKCKGLQPLTGIALLGLASAALPETPSPKPVPDDGVMLPITGLVATGQEGEELILHSPNGRYVIQGVVKDQWTGMTLTAKADARRSRRRFDPGFFGVDWKSFPGVPVGPADKPPHAVFLASQGETTRQAVATIQELSEQYRFRIIPLPNPELGMVAYRNVVCGDPAVALDFLAGEREGLPNSGCTKGQKRRIQMGAQFYPLIVRGMPQVHTPDGRVAYQLQPAEFREFLRSANRDD